MQSIQTGPSSNKKNRRIPASLRYEQIIFIDKEWTTLLYLGVSSSGNTKYAGVAQLVEHDLAKVGVTGSNPATRSIHGIDKKESADNG